jgi:hypothetical protein
LTAPSSLPAKDMLFVPPADSSEGSAVKREPYGWRVKVGSHGGQRELESAFIADYRQGYSRNIWSLD